MQKIVIVLLLISIISANSLAAGYQSAIKNNGLNWESRIITVKGYGVTKVGTYNPGRQRILARRAAVMDAKRNLAEILNGINISSSTTIKEAVTESDEIRGHVNMLIRNTQVCNEKYFPDGVVEITIQFNLNGIFEQNVSYHKEPETTMEKTDNSPLSVQADNGIYTGLIIDARKFALVPALTFKIFDTLGNQIDLKNTNKEMDLNKFGRAYYYKNMNKAKKSDRTGKNPLIVKAAGISNNNIDIIVNPDDLVKIKKLTQSLNFVDKNKIAIIIQ